MINRWYCDVCGEPINGAENGLLIWQFDNKDMNYNFKIVHKDKCDDRNFPSSYELQSCIGIDGLLRLIMFLDDGDLFDKNQRQNTVLNLSEFIEILKRLQIPNYEEARKYFKDDEIKNKLYDSYLLDQKTLKQIIELNSK